MTLNSSRTQTRTPAHDTDTERDYLSDAVHSWASSLASEDIMTSTESELAAEGTTRSGKTLICLQKVLGLHFLHKGFRSAIIRSKAVDLHNTIRKDLRFLCKYDFKDPRSAIRAEGGERFHTLHMNHGWCVLAGIDRPYAIMGTQFDLIFISQLEELSEEDYEFLLTRCGGAAANWKDKRGRICSQILADLNPTYPTAWFYKREKSKDTPKGRLRFVKFNFEDNPHFFREGRWTHAGFAYVSNLNRSLSGVYRDRFYSGLRVAAEGAVFELHACHFLEKLPANFNQYHKYRAMDFGMTDPSTCLWIAHHVQNNDTIVYREYARTHQNIIDFGKKVKQITAANTEIIADTIIEYDLNHHQLLNKEVGLHCLLARKGPGSIMDGLHLLQHALSNTMLNRPGGLRVLKKGLVVGGQDPNPDAQKGPQNLIEELQALRYDAEKPDTVVPGGDHRVDPLRYWYLWRHRGAVRADGQNLSLLDLNQRA